MKKILFLIIFTVFNFTLLIPALFGQSAVDIVSRADAIFTLNRVYQRSSMTIVKNNKKQPVQFMESYYMKKDGTGKTLTVFLEPRRVKGTSYLSVGDNLWVRFASTGRIRKLSSSAKKNSAGGSDFSYSDMGEGNTGFGEKYEVNLEGRGSAEGVDCYMVLMTPRPGSSDTYEKALAFIGVEDFTYRKINLYESGAHIKTMTFSDFRQLDIGLYPYTIRMDSLARNSFSTIDTLELEINSAKVEEHLFSKSYLEAIR